MTIYIRLKELRKQKKMTQESLARAMNMSLAAVQNIEYQKNKSVPFDTLEKICEVLGCDLSSLLTTSEKQAPLLSPKLLSLLPLPASIEAVEGRVVIKAPVLAQRVEELKQKSRSPEEEEELGAYLELMNIVSLLVLR
jgi:putative transcriptional regulator